MTAVEEKPSASDRHKKATVSFRLSDELMAAVDTLAKRERRTKTVVVEMALEAWLSKHGLWPPTESPSEDE